MPDPTDREAYEPDPRLCEVCGEPFIPNEFAPIVCDGCSEWSDVEDFMF